MDFKVTAVQKHSGGKRGNRGQQCDINLQMSYCASCAGENLSAFKINELFSDATCVLLY